MEIRNNLTDNERLFIQKPVLISAFLNKKINEKIMKIECGANHSLVVTYSVGWRQYEIYAFGHNYNKELGGYSDNFIDRPVKFGFDTKYLTMTLFKVYCGNGITALMFCNNNSTLGKEFDEENQQLILIN